MFRQYLGIKSLLTIIIIILSCIGFAVNNFFFHYEIVFLPKLTLDERFIVFGCFFIISIYFWKDAPRFSLVLRTLATIYFIGLVSLFAETAASLTPFPPHDALVQRLDLALGFNTITVLNWIHAHPILKYISWISYYSLYQAILIAPIILGILEQRREINLFLCNILLTILIGFTIYYFFPVTAPAATLHSIYFTALQKHTLAQYHAVHQNLPVLHPQAGIVGLPSFHTIWAILIAYAFKHTKYLYVAAWIFATLVILSTLTTGWHYLLDVISGIIIAIISIAITNRLNGKDLTH